jgi:hypothetical protein
LSIRAITCLVSVFLASSLHAGAAFEPPGPNVARGRSYTFAPAPDYYLCTDADDKIQLTDGLFAPHDRASSMWGFQECVGWQNAKHVVVTFDLERDTAH